MYHAHEPLCDYAELICKPTLKLKITINVTALRRHVQLGNLPDEANGTAEFVETINDLFDLFNCFGGSSDPRKRPVYADNLPSVLAVSHKLAILLLQIFILMLFIM